MTPAEWKGQILFQVESQIDFRERKAAEYPDDERNAQSAEVFRMLRGRLSREVHS